MLAGVLCTLSAMPRFLLRQAPSESVRHPVPRVARRFGGSSHAYTQCPATPACACLLPAVRSQRGNFYATHHRGGPFPCRANFLRFAPKRCVVCTVDKLCLRLDVNRVAPSRRQRRRARTCCRVFARPETCPRELIYGKNAMTDPRRTTAAFTATQTQALPA